MENQPSHQSCQICSLHMELLEGIFQFLPVSSWSAVLSTCKRFYEVGRRSFDPSINHNGALFWACQNERWNFLLELVTDQRVDPSKYQNVAIRTAAKEGFGYSR
jgi:hypothetical protein